MSRTPEVGHIVERTEVRETVRTTVKTARNLTPEEVEEEPPGRPGITARRLFADIPQADWDDWKWHFRNRITTVDELAKYIPLSPREQTHLKLVAKKFPLSITPYYLSLIFRMTQTTPSEGRRCPPSWR